MNSFGLKYKTTTFGESHGLGVGGVVDGMPAGIKFDHEFLQNELNRRKGGGKFTTPRAEDDEIVVYSGVFEGYTTGTPIGFVVYNRSQRSKDYENVKDIFRPGHADMGYFDKFQIRDYRGGGRSSARESIARVASGAIAQMLLNEFNITVQSGVYSVGEIQARKIDFQKADASEIFSLDLELEMKEEIQKAKSMHDSIGGVVFSRVTNCPKGLGEVLYAKLDAKLAEAIVGINGVKAVEIGAGIQASKMKGSTNNDQISKDGFFTNNSGGILGGISNGDLIELKSYFKPTPSIFLPQKTVDINKEEKICNLKGRHDPCIAIRGSVVVTAMIRQVLADMLLLNATSKLENLKRVYFNF